MFRGVLKHYSLVADPLDYKQKTKNGRWSCMQSPSQFDSHNAWAPALLVQQFCLSKSDGCSAPFSLCGRLFSSSIVTCACIIFQGRLTLRDGCQKKGKARSWHHMPVYIPNGLSENSKKVHTDVCVCFLTMCCLLKTSQKWEGEKREVC